MTGPREPVDRDLLTETIRLFGMAVEYKGQVFNPAEVVVHTNGVTELQKLQAAWTVILRWQARTHGLEADRLFYEMMNALTMGVDLPAIEQADVAAASDAIESMRDELARKFPGKSIQELSGITAAAGFENIPVTHTVSYLRAPECTCSCITEDVRDPDEICTHPDCLFGKDPSCPVHGKQARAPITWKESAVLATGQTLDEFADQLRRECEGNWTPPDRPEVGDETEG